MLLLLTLFSTIIRVVYIILALNFVDHFLQYLLRVPLICYPRVTVSDIAIYLLVN